MLRLKIDSRVAIVVCLISDLSFGEGNLSQVETDLRNIVANVAASITSEQPGRTTLIHLATLLMGPSTLHPSLD